MKIEIISQSSDVDKEGAVTQKVLWMLTFPKGIIFMEAKFEKVEARPAPHITISSLIHWDDLPKI